MQLLKRKRKKKQEIAEQSRANDASDIWQKKKIHVAEPET